MIIIVTGVSGSGKTTVGTLLSRKTKLPFFDADDFHPTSNVEKMTKGIPLNDHDRGPWLENLASHIQKWNREGGAILACSALKESYRNVLQVEKNIFWVHLKGDKLLLEERLQNRKNHYMNPSLLDSQLDTWEEPEYGFHIDVNQSPESIINEIFTHINFKSMKSKLGIIGMGVMGKSLALNFAEKGIGVSVFNRTVAGQEEKVASTFAEENQEYPFLKGFDSMEDFLSSLETPKKILLMIPAGEAVDAQLDQLGWLLEQGDIIIDGGNSFYKDSNRRISVMKEKEINFMAMGVSGGEEGARKGPSIMPSGNREAFDAVSPFLQKIAAKDKEGGPCLTYVGPEGSGHFIKMVHNSIEYGEMQAIAESVHLLKYGLKLSHPEISRILKTWLGEGLNSYLLEITSDIFLAKEGDQFLVDIILDAAGQKGTGGWSLQTALEYHVPYSPLAEAVTARQLSAQKSYRSELSKVFNHRFRAFGEDKVILMERIKNAYSLCRILNHETGFSLMKEVSDENGWDLDFSEIARIWTNGCIIRSGLMEELIHIYKETDSLLKHKKTITKIRELKTDLAYIVGLGLQHDFALPVFSAAANYLLGRITEDSAANIIQAQRDYFGAHRYQRKDGPEGGSHHTDWLSMKKSTGK
ncbi:NADP-dependent phosphogluconate dehydrogenase [Arthrospiribacter ruber]|uniref:6-phosphogluconate dehydrogenase, decarboxylating n=1 Tax=Arthrospiribacter ruber TaxID=2487934 RepID=A0A951ITH5_9BACT|nr:NADP-dependent phosphogluconate dehydrogenase [Arthrospiribacter ruber]MBW3467130.1 NADP-dependent phosphogluconate dehydrogenase [Arthrospiribacter ruber]